MQARPLKRPFDQVIKGPSSRFGGILHNKQHFTLSPQALVCGFCQLPGHHRGECRRANRLCLACRARDHQLVNCPSKRQRSVMPIAPASEAVKKNPVPAGRGVPLPPQRQVFKQSQRRAGAGRGRGQAFNLIAEGQRHQRRWWQVPFWFIQFQLYHYLIPVLHISIYLLVLLRCILYPVMIWTLNGD